MSRIIKHIPLLCESDVGAACAAGGCIVDTCASCIEAACAGSEPRWPEIATACPWRALLIVVGTWAIVVAIWATAVPGTWCTPGAWCNVVGLWCNVVGTCGIPPGICGTCGIWASSWLAYWHGVSGRPATEWGMLPCVCLRRRALRLLNHTWSSEGGRCLAMGSARWAIIAIKKRSRNFVYYLEFLRDPPLSLSLFRHRIVHTISVAWITHEVFFSRVNIFALFWQGERSSIFFITSMKCIMFFSRFILPF